MNMPKRKNNHPVSAPENSGKNEKKSTQKHRLTAKGWVAVLVVIAIAIISVFVYFNQPSAIDRLSLTYLDSLEKDSLAYTPQSEYESSYEINDFIIYGESLTLYHQAYSDNGYDDLYGKNVMLKNIETGVETSYTLSGGVDGGIPLGQLQPGVYEIYVYDEFTPKRAYAPEAIDAEIFTTMRRNKEVNSVNLCASETLLSRFGITQDKNYLYLIVTDSLPRVKIIDILIDPSGLTTYASGNGVVEGYQGELIDENSASYELALKIQEYLGDAGLKAEISRDPNTEKGYFGNNSRTFTGYQKQAKVFLGLAMSDGEESRPYILTSPFTNGLLGNEIAYDCTQNGVQMEEVSKLPRLNQGVGYDTLYMDENYEYLPYSASAQIRETGGKATFAGQSETSKANVNFSDSYGMYGLIYFYASTESTDSQIYYQQNKDLIARSIAQGILDYFDIPPVDEKETG